jgi:phosphatidylinositol 4-kinase type 2
VSLIGQPFSKKTRDHFLPILTSTSWWSETQLALRHVFNQDADFKESMFARQIAVMKGQAWNVVETLKQRDHGPLELTRRTRVCVWDDLVDVPVAIPLRTPSSEMQRKRFNDYAEQAEEMDISAANASEQNLHPDLLSFPSPTSELPNPNRFSLSREESSADLGRIREEPSTRATTNNVSFDHVGSAGIAKQSLSQSATSSRPQPGRTRTSFEGSRKRGNSGGQRRRFSFSTRYGSTAFLYNDDDLEGDLGYAAAEGMEGNQRKVIVERLETVKSKNPVFTWC